MTGAPTWGKACTTCGGRPRAKGRSQCRDCRRLSQKTSEVRVDLRSETAGIVSPAVELLNKLPGVLAIRLNSGVLQRNGRYIRLAPKGTADIFAVADGQAFFFEAKRAGEKQSAEQEKFSIRAVDSGAKYFVITAARQAAEEIAIWRQR